MSPVAGKGQSNLRTTLLVAVGGVVAAAAMLLLVVSMSSAGRVELRIGDDRFNAGSVRHKAEEITERGPILYADVGGGSRDIWVNHFGDDPEEGWAVFDARRLDVGRECNVTWDGPVEVFTDPCSGETIAADGGELPRYSTVIEDGRLLVDLSVRLPVSTETTTDSSP